MSSEDNRAATPGAGPADPRSSVHRAWGRSAVLVYSQAKRARNRLFTAALSGGFAQFGRGSSLAPPAGVAQARHIAIGSGVVLGPYCTFMVHGEPGPDVVRITIGDGVTIIGFCTISAWESVVIEAGAMFARSVYISDHSHRYDDPGAPVKQQGVSAIAPVVIGAGAWLGENVVITPGVRVGAGAVVAANSVVRDDVPDHCLAAGAPARIVKSWAVSTPAD